VNPFVTQLDTLLKEVDAVRNRSKYSDLSDVLNEMQAVAISTRAYAAIERISGKNSPYARQAEKIRGEQINEHDKAARLFGVLDSLSADVKAGYLQSLEELVHGELFGDFLDMAQHLAQAGYKDAAAVIAGSSLEAHLRQIAKRFGVPTDHVTSRGTEPKKADQLNADLVKAGAYSILDQKNVTAWVDLRNKAAHGKYSEYTKEQVDLLIDSVRDFVTRHPA
jgi:hypothetical protein